MSTRTKYWVCQAIGWGAYAVAGVFITASYVGFSVALVAGYALFFLYSIGLTDLLRRAIKRGRWLDPPRRLLWLRIALSVLAIATIQTLLVISLNLAMNPRAQWPREAILGLAWGTFCATGTWTALYTRLTERRRRDEREVQLQLALREAELRALQHQVNPHFLFNSLNSIRGLVIENPPRAQEMVTRLANMLRYNLQREPRETASLESEVEVAADYLALEAVRFEERLRVRFDVDPALNHVQIPPMLLQTLVENAIKHGIAPSPAGGDIEVRVARSGSAVRIDVASSGQLRETRPDAVGLANARERLRLLYGERASLTLANGHGRVTATVTIPEAR